MTSSPSSSDTPACYELVIPTKSLGKDFLIQTLLDLGESDFVEGALDCGVDLDLDDEPGAVDFFEESSQFTPIVFYSEDRERLLLLRDRLIAGCALLEKDAPALCVESLTNQDWRQSWKASFKPLQIGNDFVVVPPWDAEKTFPAKHKITIDPGLAFGTGQHETTQLCLELLCEVISPAQNRSVLDVGTGSGILAIAAEMLGAKDVLGCDIDTETVAVAAENAKINQCIRCEFTATPLANITESSFDIVIANIHDKVLRRLFPAMLPKLKPGHFVFSGLLNSEVSAFENFLAEHNIQVLMRRQRNDWSALLCGLAQ